MPPVGLSRQADYEDPAHPFCYALGYAWEKGQLTLDYVPPTVALSDVELGLGSVELADGDDADAEILCEL